MAYSYYLALAFICVSVGLVTYQLAPVYLARLKKTPEPKFALIEKIVYRLSTIFIDVPSKRILYMFLALFCGLSVLGLVATKSIIGLFSGAAMAIILPAFIVKIIEMRRRSAFKGQLVDALMILSSSLRAGLSLIQAIEELTGEMPAPLSQEFGLLLRENHMGVPLEEAFMHLRERMKVEDLDLIITAILVARDTGGDLTQTFSRLTFTIREKEKLIGRVKSLCTQGKLQGIVMIFLPIFFAFAVFGMNKDFFNTMTQDKTGQFLIVYAVVSEIIGAYLIMKLSKIEV